MVKRLRKWPLELIAEKVSTVESFESEETGSTAACYFRLGRLSNGRVSAAHLDVLRWANNLGS